MFQQILDMLPWFRQRQAFPTAHAPIHKKKLFLLSGRAVFRCGHKSLQEKSLQTN